MSGARKRGNRHRLTWLASAIVMSFLCSCSSADMGARLDKFGSEIAKSVKDLIAPSNDATATQAAQEQATTQQPTIQESAETVPDQEVDVNSVFDKLVDKRAASTEVK